jgi:hypothetical protein
VSKKTSEEVLGRLNLFVKRTAELKSRRMLKSEKHWTIKFRSDAENNSFGFHIDGPDEEDFRSFLLIFRQFISPSEPIYIRRIFNDCIRNLPDCDLRSYIIQVQHAWNERVTAGPMAIVIGGRKITPEYGLDLFINGDYFHNDQGKAEVIKVLSVETLQMLRLAMQIAIPDLVDIIVYTSRVIEKALSNCLFESQP